MEAIARTESDGPGAIRIEFDNGNVAIAGRQDGADAGTMLAALGLPGGTETGPGAILVFGGASMADDALARATELLGPAVAAAAGATGATVLDGGTAAGVMQLTGAARAQGPAAMPVLVGVAPRGLVTYPGPGGNGGAGSNGVALDQNHSHFALADGDEWGAETGLLLALAARVGHGRAVVVLAGGGEIAKAEALGAVRRGWPIFVIAGTGGLADGVLDLGQSHRTGRPRRGARFLPRAWRRRAPEELSTIADADLREIVGTGDIRPVTDSEPGQLARQIAWEVQDEPVLKSAWQLFATYDQLAARLRITFQRLQASILLIGILATLLGLIYSRTGVPALHWTVVALPILAAVLISVAGRRAVGQRWVMLRAAAEAVKTEIYRYRTLAVVGAAGPEAPDVADVPDVAGAPDVPDEPDEPGGATREQRIAAQLGVIEARLMQTQASSGSLAPYAGPLPPRMYGAGSDDDGLSPMGADRYLEIRVGDQLSYYHGRIASLDRVRNALQLVAIAVGAAGAVLAAAGLEVWIGLTSGISAAALAYLGYLQIDNTIVGYNQAAAKLATLDREWRALGLARHDPAALRDLVARSEAVLDTEGTGWVQQMSESLEELKNKQAEAERQLTGD